MKPRLTDRIVSYLKKENKDVKRAVLQKICEKHGYSSDVFFVSLEIADTTANIGKWQDYKTKVNYIRWYPPNDLTNQVQECLDRGYAW
jgi:hypothetical protein